MHLGRGYWLLGAFAAAVLLIGGLVVEPRVGAPGSAPILQDGAEPQLPAGMALFVQFHRASRAVLRGSNPYATATGPKDAVSIKFNHPPPTVLPYLPLGPLSLRTAAMVNGLLNIMLLSLACYLSGRAFSPRKRWVPLVCTVVWPLWIPSWRLLAVGQNTTFVLVSLLGWLVASRSGRHWLAGGLLSITVVKPHTALLPGAYAAGASLVPGRRKGLIAALLSVLAWVAIATLVAPASWEQFVAHIKAFGPQTAYVTDTLTSRGVIALGPSFRWIAYCVFVLGVFLAFSAGVASRDDRLLPGRLSIAATASPCLLPHAYDYDWVMLLPFCVAVVALLLDRVRLHYLWLPVAWLAVTGYCIVAQYQADPGNMSALWWIPWLGLTAQSVFTPVTGLDCVENHAPSASAVDQV